MRPVLAKPGDLEVVSHVVRETIQTVYPGYYPQGAIDFFLQYHSDGAILSAISRDEVYLFEEDNDFIATGSVEGDYLTRLFVLPEYQGKGYGGRIMDFLEDLAFQNHAEARLDASLPAVGMYLKRGYVIASYHMEPTFRDHYLCYFDMRKQRPV